MKKILVLLPAFIACSLSFPCASTAATAMEALEASLPRGLSVPAVPPVPAGLSGEALFQELHTRTDFSQAGNGTNYLRAKKYMFSVSDNLGCDGGPGVTCLYSRVCAKGSTEHGEDYKEAGDLNGDGFVDADGMNAEHAWPQSFFNKALPMVADLHHIFPTFIKPNNTRGSAPYGLVSRAAYDTASGTKFDGKTFEPADASKGDVARAILYFVTRYYDRNIRDGVDYRDFWTSRVQMFLDWNRQDPPDAAEKRRNDLIEQFQGNRNPFVDDHTLADRVGAQVFQSH